MVWPGRTACAAAAPKGRMLAAEFRQTPLPVRFPSGSGDVEALAFCLFGAVFAEVCSTEGRRFSGAAGRGSRDLRFSGRMLYPEPCLCICPKPPQRRGRAPEECLFRVGPTGSMRVPRSHMEGGTETRKGGEGSAGSARRAARRGSGGGAVHGVAGCGHALCRSAPTRDRVPGESGTTCGSGLCRGPSYPGRVLNHPREAVPSPRPPQSAPGRQPAVRGDAGAGHGPAAAPARVRGRSAAAPVPHRAPFRPCSTVVVTKGAGKDRASDSGLQ